MNVTLTYGSLYLTDYPYGLEFGADFGAPENVTQALAMLLQDGEVEMTERTSNRTIQFNVWIEGPDLAAMADAEAALMLQANQPRNTLTIDPGDGFGPSTVYETYRAQVTWLRDDNFEMQNLRRYSVTIKAMPAGRSAAEEVAPALAASGTTTTLVNNGSATTGWTGAVDGVSVSPTVVSGAVKVTNGSAVFGSVVVSATLTTGITTSSTKYLTVDWKPDSGAGNPTLRAFGDGIELSRIAQIASPTPGYTRSTFYVDASSIATALRLDLHSDIPGPASVDYAGSAPATRSLYVDNINRTDIKPSLGTARQLLRSIEVAGTARTQGAVAIEHETSALGDVLVYFFPDVEDTQGYVPCLRPYRVSGPAVTTDTSLASGAHEDLTAGTTTFDVPCQRMPAGTYALTLRTLNADPAATVTWTASTLMGGTPVGSTTSGTFSLPISAALTYGVTTIALLTLPTLNIDPTATTATARVTLTATAAGPVELDEAWLFSMSIGQLTWVACGAGTAASGGPARRLFIEPATAARPLPTVRVGHAADRSDSYFPPGEAIASWQHPQLIPPRVNVFTVTTNALDAAVSLRHYPRWELNAAI